MPNQDLAALQLLEDGPHGWMLPVAPVEVGLAGADEAKLVAVLQSRRRPDQAQGIAIVRVLDLYQGTPTFMSPEQAAGRLDLLGPAQQPVVLVLA